MPYSVNTIECYSGGTSTAPEIPWLAGRASRQDTAAFANLYRLHAPLILRYVASRVSSPEDAEDLTDSIFEKAFAAIDRYEPSPSPFATWLYTIARNAVIDHYRKRRLPSHEGAEDELRRATDPEGDPEAKMLADERRQRLRLELLTLTDEQRQVLCYRFFFNYSIHEVAQAMGKTEGAVKALQFRALERLRRRLAPKWLWV